MTVVEIAQGAKVIVRALCTLPAHAHDVRLVTLIARDTLVTDSCMQMKTQIEKFVSAETSNEPQMVLLLLLLFNYNTMKKKSNVVTYSIQLKKKKKK